MFTEWLYRIIFRRLIVLQTFFPPSRKSVKKIVGVQRLKSVLVWRPTGGVWTLSAERRQFLAFYRQRRHFLFTFFCCRKKVKACPAWGQIGEYFIRPYIYFYSRIVKQTESGILQNIPFAYPICQHRCYPLNLRSHFFAKELLVSRSIGYGSSFTLSYFKIEVWIRVLIL